MTRRRTLPAGIVAACVAAAFLANPTTSFADGGSAPQPPPVGLHDNMGGLTNRTDTIIVTFDKDQRNPAAAAERVVEQAIDDASAVTQVVPITEDTVSVTIDKSMTPIESATLGKQVEGVGGVDTAEPAATFVQESTNDTYYSLLWNISNNPKSPYGTRAEDAWPATLGSGAVVGVVDTGITAHTDLSGSTSSIVGGNIVAGYDFISTAAQAGDGDGRDADPSDVGDYCDGDPSSWHGTHVSGIAVAIRNNGTGVVGVAPGAKVQPLRALGHCGGAEGDIISAMRWGAGLPVVGIPALNPTPVSVLNLSLGSLGRCSSAMQSAIDAAVGQGVPVVIAAGNSTAPVADFTPAGCRNVIRVAATSYEGQLAPYSNFGTAALPVTISAPGGSGKSNSMNDWIVSTWNHGTTTVGAEAYMGMDGTSMAAPHVAAVVALLKSLDKALTPAQVSSILAATGTPLPAPCDTTRCGPGAVNAANAVAYEAKRLLSAVAAPTIDGSTHQGSILTAHVSGVPAMANVSYQWFRKGKPVTGATGSTYRVGGADAGSSISVQVRVAIGKTTVASSSRVIAIPGTPPPGTFGAKSAPTVSGAWKVGKKLKGKPGVQSPAPTKVSYRWLRSGKSISRATKSTYKLSKKDKRKRISVRVTVSRAGYTTAVYISASHKVS